MHAWGIQPRAKVSEAKRDSDQAASGESVDSHTKLWSAWTKGVSCHEWGEVWLPNLAFQFDSYSALFQTTSASGNPLDKDTYTYNITIINCNQHSNMLCYVPYCGWYWCFWRIVSQSFFQFFLILNTISFESGPRGERARARGPIHPEDPFQGKSCFFLLPSNLFLSPAQ